MIGFTTLKTSAIAMIAVSSMIMAGTASALPEANAPAAPHNNIAKRTASPCGGCGGWHGWNGWNGCGNCGGWGGSMKQFISLSLLSLLAPLAAIAQSTEGLQSTSCLTSSSSSSTTDLYEAKVEVKYAKYFSIDYHNTYKVVNNLSTNDTYVLYQCGSDKPSVDNASAFIPIPVTSAAAWATTAAIFLEALGVQNDIKNLGTAPSIVSACLQKLLEDVIEPFNESNSTQTDQQEDSNTVVFNMPGGDDDTANTVYSVEYLEGSALGRSEWVKFFAAFFNAEERANTLFDSIDSNYQCFSTKANDEYNDIRPVVAWTSYAAPTEYNNNTAYWQISFADYKYDIVRDAGARMLNTTGTQSTMFSTSQAFLDALEEVDIVIDESFVSYTYDDLLTNYGITDKSKSQYSWVSTDRVYRPDRIQSTAGGLGWFEAPVAFADALLQDLIGVAHPNFSKEGYQPIWFRNLANDDPVTVVTAANCTDVYAQRKDPAGTCSSIDFQSANPTDSAYSGVDQNETQDLVYDLSKSEIIDDDDSESAKDSKSSDALSVRMSAVSSVLAISLLAALC
ncbi:hypothetical protein LPJ53_000811 [Coemansia erecta]|uniref:Periplasmic binding protein-like II n=1 Tax=Coemansia erecta TaxID=147472 RepID=A0A9W7Y5J9_9FUNG|nr:hypothetical protein LPJ53_000811 [Coemansia erecta]